MQLAARPSAWLVALACLVVVGAARAQTPSLVFDLNRTSLPNLGSGGSSFARLGAHVYFTADDGRVGAELWRSDGTAAGTQLVIDGAPGTSSTQPIELNVMGTRLAYLGRRASVLPHTLWLSDGTAAGTGAVPGLDGASFTLRFGNLVAFQGYDATHGSELWVTDSTAAGTRLVIDLVPGSRGSHARPIAVHRGLLYFAALDPIYGNMELWVTDGTAVGTRMVVFSMRGSAPQEGIEFAGSLYVTIGAFAHWELWRTDGTPAGTVAVAQPGQGRLHSLTAIGTQLFFAASPNEFTEELWRFDATAGASSLGQFAFGISALARAPNGRDLLFSAHGTTDGQELWRTDGTVAGTRQVLDINPGPAHGAPSFLTPVGSHVYFRANHAAHGFELWRTDGTAGGTALFDDILPGPVSSEVWWLWGGGNDLWFSADDGVHGTEPRIVGAGASSSRLVADIRPRPPGTVGSNPRELVDLFGATLFVADDGRSGHELWRVGGPGTTPQLLADIVPGPAGSFPTSLTRFGNEVFFAVVDELWKTDGTPSGTTRVLRASPRGVAPPFLLTVAGDSLYFVAFSAAHGDELWRTDGTAAGTHVVADIRPGVASSNPRHLTALGSTLFLLADDGVHGQDLWTTDGTAAGTRMALDLRQPPSATLPTPLVAFAGALHFAADLSAVGSEPLGVELWRTDGTVGGTALVADIHPGARGSDPRGFCAVGDQLFFVADARDAAGELGVELWRTDGTTAGTRLVFDIVPSPYGSWPHDLAPFGGRVLFTAYTDATGDEPWVSDGTAAGTVPLGDLAPGPNASNPLGYFATGSRFAWFVTRTVSERGVLWRTDGTPAGTRRLTSAAGSHLPGLWTVSGTQLRFTFDDPLTGQELFELDPGASVTRTGVGCGTGLRTPGLQATDPVLGSVMRFLGHAAPTGAGGVLVVGSPAAMRRFGGCEVHVDLGRAVVVAAFPLPSPTWTQTLPLPSSPALLDVAFTSQALFAPAPAGIETTPALLGRIGR